MFDLSVAWWELIVRGAVSYLFLLVILRVGGKREIGQLAPFDFVLLLLLSDAVQNSMNGGDDSMVGGLITAATLVVLNSIVGWATFRSRRLEAIVDGRPQVLIHDGRPIEENLKQAKISRQELDAALRAAGHDGISKVSTAILETNGSISVLAREEKRED
jgi:uncharacterized membrane protein YcaP (DUF421 family)